MKLRLVPDPTFKAKVAIPVPGQRDALVEFTFKYRNADQLLEWVSNSRDALDADLVFECAIGWALDDEFTADNVRTLCNNYPGAGNAIVSVYLDESRGARAKN